jgi:peptidoglycan/xylan/chitin deacetylase (PgdA/CDA1 family)
VTHNALSVDLEEYFQVSNFERCIDRGSWDDQPSRVGDTAARLLDAFEATGNRATFFVLGWIAERHGAPVAPDRSAWARDRLPRIRTSAGVRLYVARIFRTRGRVC